ncbi:MAG: response regulator [bacterium]|nr:response regulator [bacterium]MCP5070701.1 response regulator [bacterium]
MKVLLIDDSGVMRKMITRALRQSGVDVESVTEAGNGQEGLEALGKGSFELIICDWNMPVMNGLDFVKKAREDDQTPIMMLSTEGTEDKVQEALDAGANAYLTKPFTPEKLEAKINQVV